MHSLTEPTMADRSALQLIGLTLAALSVATILVAAVVVHRTMKTDLNREFPTAAVRANAS